VLSSSVGKQRARFTVKCCAYPFETGFLDWAAEGPILPMASVGMRLEIYANPMALRTYGTLLSAHIYEIEDIKTVVMPKSFH